MFRVVSRNITEIFENHFVKFQKNFGRFREIFHVVFRNVTTSLSIIFENLEKNFVI